MAEKNLTFNLKADDDASKVFEKIGRTAKTEMGKVEDSLDDTRTAGKRAADALSTVFDQLDVAMTQTKATADRLGQAMGPELSAKINPAEAIAEFRRLGLTLEDIESEADQLAAALKKADDVSLKHFSGQADMANTSMRNLHSSSDQSRSVMANLTGNAAQDLGAVSGVAGSAGVAIGQLAEYAVDGSIKLRNLAMIAGPMAALGVGIALVSRNMKIQAERAAASKKQLDDFTEAIRDGGDAVSAFRKELEDTGELELPSLFGDAEDIVPILDRAGVSVEQFGKAIEGGEESSRQLLDALKAAGVGGNDLEEIMEALAAGTNSYELATERAAVISALLGGELEKVDKKAKDADDAVDGAGESMDDAADDADGLAKKLASVDKAWGEMMDEIDDDQALIDIHDQFANLKQAADDAFFAAASGSDEASQKARDYQSEINATKQRVAEYGQEVLGLKPEQVTKIIADIDNGSVDRAEKLLVALSKDRTATITVATKGKTFARGGTVGPDGGIAGEAGLEVLAFPGGAQAVVNSPTAVPPGTVVTPINGVRGGVGATAGSSGAAGVTNNYITVHAMDGRDVIRIIKDYERNNGKGWRAS